MKKIMGFAFGVAALVMMSGCSKSSAAKGGKKAVTLTVWESLSGPDEFIKQAGAKYTELHPDVKINFVNVELSDSTGRIALDGPAGIGADLFAAPHDKLGELVNSGLVLPTADADSVGDQILGACKQAVTYDGKMYGYPISAETYALFYNKAYVPEDKVPSTWDDLSKFAQNFNASNPGKRGFIMNTGAGYYTIIFTTANGNRLFGPNGNDSENTNINNEISVKGMEFFQSLRSALDVPSSDLEDGFCDAAFQSGNAAMHITGLWNVKNFTDAGIDFGVAPLPALPGDTKPASSFSGTRAMFVSAFTDHPEEAADFAKFLITPEMQRLRFELTGAMPSISTEVSSPYIEGFLKQLDYAFPMPSIPQMAAYWEAMNSASKNIWNGADVKSELDACNASIVSNIK